MPGKIVVFCLVMFMAFTGIAQKANSKFIMHKVVSGESLYKIGKKYGVTVDDILKNNAGVTAESLKPGMTLRIPAKNTPSQSAGKPDGTIKKQQNHIVLPKETLYSISKKYGVTVDQIRKWNDLTGESIQEGAVLVIYPNQPPSDKTTVTPDKKPETNPVPAEKPVPTSPNKPEIPVKEDLPSDAQPEEVLTITALSKKFLSQQKTGTPLTEKGTAALMASSSSSSSNTYFALHKSAPIGCILKIKNLENGKVTYAKVIGKLPDLDENKYVMVRISLGVSKALQMGYGKAYVEMTYAQ